MNAMVERARTVEAYDQMIGENNAEGNAVVQAVIDQLAVLARDFRGGDIRPRHSRRCYHGLRQS